LARATTLPVGVIAVGINEPDAVDPERVCGRIDEAICVGRDENTPRDRRPGVGIDATGTAACPAAPPAGATSMSRVTMAAATGIRVPAAIAPLERGERRCGLIGRRF
jgi:hypothetical protein